MKRLIVAGLAVLLLLPLSVSAEKLLEGDTIQVYDPVSNKIIKNFYPGSNSPYQVYPGDEICFITWVKNVGDELVPANTYRADYYVLSNPSIFDKWGTLEPLSINGDFSIPPGNAQQLPVTCSHILDTASPGVYLIWLDIFDTISIGSYEGYSIYYDAIEVLDSEDYDYTDVSINWVQGIDPEDAYEMTPQGEMIDISMNPVLTADITISSDSSSEAAFSGELFCDGYPLRTITNLMPGEERIFEYEWGDEYFQNYEPGERMSFYCRLYEDGWPKDDLGFWPYATDSNVALLRISHFGVDKDSYEPGDTGTVIAQMSNLGNDITGSSYATFRVLIDGQEILNADAPFTVDSMDDVVVSKDFIVPEGVGGFQSTIEQCISVYPDGFEHAVLHLFYTVYSVNTPPGEYCYTTEPEDFALATCGELVEGEEYWTQECHCTDAYCYVPAPEGAFITDVDYDDCPAVRHKIIEGHHIALFKNLNIWPGGVLMTYVDAGVPSFDLSILSIIIVFSIVTALILASKDKYIEPCEDNSNQEH